MTDVKERKSGGRRGKKATLRESVSQVIVQIKIQLTLKKHGCELCGFTYQ